jgi:hypothetical protein
MAIARKFGKAFASTKRRHRSIIDLASDRPLQDRRINEGGAWVSMRRR